ncbi:MAG: S-layer homology domain-containing protein [Sedimentibacter sp.]
MYNKLKLLIFIVILLMVEVTPSFASEIYSMNSEQLTYIYTVDDFDKTYTDTTGFFILMNDLDLSTSKYVGLINFAGTFYGNGHILSNFTSYSGIFSSLNNAEIYDLGIEPGTTTRGIIASNIYNSKLENIYVNKIPDDSISPFVCYLYDSTLNYVYTTGKAGISIYSSGNTVNSVYYNSENYLGSTTVGEGLSTTEMHKQINYIDWDFNNIWTIDEDVFYPTLTNYDSFKLVGTNAYYNGAKNEISLKLFFNQELKIGTGNIHIFKKEDDSELLTLKSTDSVLDVKIATLSSKISLDENTEYYIKVDADAFDNGSSDQVTDTFKVLYFESGDGTNEQPYEIYNCEDLKKIHEGPSYAYKLMADLDLDEESMIPIGDYETPFTSVFDGNEHVIYNYYFEGLDESYIGLFGYSKGSIKNLGLKDLNINIQASMNSSVDLSGAYVAGLVGFNAGIIENCYTTGEVLGRTNVGGLVGNNCGGITLCYSEANVTSSDYYYSGYNNEGYYTGGLAGRSAISGTISMSYATGNVTGCEQVGGLVGNTYYSGLISNSYATGNVTGYKHVGGLMGRNYYSSTVENVYSSGTVSLYEGGSSSGGLIGIQGDDSVLTNGYYNQETSGKSDDEGKGSPKTAFEMISQATYVEFDFDDTWTIIEGRSTPYLNLNKTGTIPGLINHAPDLTTTDIYTVEDTDLTGYLLGTDEDGDTINYTLVQMASSGSIHVTTSGAFTYIPNENFSGDDQFYVDLTDGFVTTTSAAIKVHVASVNNAPLVANKTFEVYYNDVLLINLESLVEDEDGDALTFDFDPDLIFGTACILADSSQLSYTPINTGVETLVYSVSDANITTKAAITINIINAEQLAPTGLTVTKTSEYNNNGAITGTDSTMEYKNINNSDWLEVTSNKISGLCEGTYILRYKAKLGYNAGENAYVTVETIDKSTSSDDSNDKDDIYLSTTSLSTSSVLVPTVLNTTDTIQIIDGRNVTQVNIETDEIIEYLNDATQNSEKQKLVSFETLQSNDTAQFILTGEAVDLFNKNQVNYSFILPQVKYQFPSNAIDIKLVATDLGVSESQYADIKIGVNIKMTSQELLSDSFKGKALMAPIWFEITASYTSESGETKTIAVNTFDSYVKRSFILPEDIDTTQVTTGVVVNTDGSYAHIPTILIQTYGEWEVQMNSMTNSGYTIINNVVEVPSVSGHWSENVVNRLASDLVLVDYASFKPDEAVTRGEFIDYVVRGLGLYREELDFETKLNDIENSTYEQSVKIADYWGIISGYENGTFKPNNQISREEAMMVFSNVLMLIQFENTLTDNHDISQYYDKTEVSSWAVDAVNMSLSIGIFNGRSDQELAPKETLTCAEALIAVNNLLIKTNLISEN